MEVGRPQTNLFVPYLTTILVAFLLRTQDAVVSTASALRITPPHMTVYGVTARVVTGVTDGVGNADDAGAILFASTGSRLTMKGYCCVLL